jgi:glutathione S-transferase
MRSYTDAEIRAFSRMSWWEYAAKQGLPASVGPRASQRIEPGPGSYAARRRPARDFLSEPLDYLSLPLNELKEA